MPHANPTLSVVMPVYNAARYLPATVPALAAALGAFGGAELILADNGSTDGSWEWMQAHAPAGSTVIQQRGVNVGELRNLAARQSRGAILSFLDADCLIGPDYFARAVAALERTTCAATGSRYALPDRPGWIEAAWESLHGARGDGDVPYINSGNFVVRRAAFDAVGGFDPALVSGEDAELCFRLRAAGHCLHESHDVRAVHLGNPKTLRAFFRKQLWHGMGALGTARLEKLDKPLLMTIAHVAVVLGGLVFALMGSGGTATKLAVALGAWLVIPAAAVAYRCVSGRRLRGALGGVALYLLYFSARAVALARITARGTR